MEKKIDLVVFLKQMCPLDLPGSFLWFIKTLKKNKWNDYNFNSIILH